MSRSEIHIDGAALSLSSLPRCTGFTFLLIANNLIMREPSILLEGLGIAEYDLSPIRIFLNAAFVGALLAVGIASFMRGREAAPRNMVFLQCASGLGALILFGAGAISSPDGALSSATLHLAFILLGLFASFGLLHWIALFSKTNLRAVWLEIVTALFVSPLGYVFALYASASFPAILIFGFFCASSLAINGVACTRGGKKPNAEQITCKPASFRRYLPTVLCIAALNYVLATSRMSLAELNPEAVNMIYACGVCLAALLLFLSSFIAKKDLEIGLIYRVAFPIIALAFLLLPYAGVFLRGLFMLLATSLGTMGTTLLILIALRARETCKLTATSAYGILSGIVHVALTAGLIINPESETSLVQSSVAALIVVYVLLLVFLISQRSGKSAPKKAATPSTTDLDLGPACIRIGEEHGLTQRETEIMREMASGRSSGEIARSLGISTSTVKTHVKSIYRKLDIHAKEELIALVSEEPSSL